MRIVRFVSVFLIALFVSTAAFAQEGEPVTNEKFGVEITPPAKWEVTEGNEKAVANFKHTGSQSQIEVVGTKLMTENVSDVFFETFHKTLKESNFEQVSQEQTSIGDYEGTKTNYKFTHSGVTLEVVVFEFLQKSTAWLTVGYMQDVEKDKYIGDFESVVKNINFTGSSDGGDDE
jgi:hypothetical protein